MSHKTVCDVGVKVWRVLSIQVPQGSVVTHLRWGGTRMHNTTTKVPLLSSQSASERIWRIG